MNITPGDLDILARTVWGEARGTGYHGMKAVAHVMINRWRATTGQFARDDTIATACLRHLQFSAWTEGDPNFEKMQSVTLADKTFRDCIRAALEALDEYDFTFGSRHYHTKTVDPAWSRGKEPALTAGNHIFFNTIE